MLSKLEQTKLKTEKFIKRSKEKYGDKYNYEETQYIGCDTKIKIRCAIHNEVVIEQTLRSHFRHDNEDACYICSRISKSKKTGTYIEKFIAIHGNKYDYSETVYNCHKEKIVIICPQHGPFLQMINNHLLGRGCKDCANKLHADRMRITQDDFIRKAVKVHGDRYDYSLVDYNDYLTEVKIICKLHGPFLQTVGVHLKGSSCQQCSKNVCKLKRMDTIENFIIKANNVHGNRYNYDDVIYEGSKKKVIINCQIHGQFSQQPANHLIGHGCYSCGLEIITKSHSRTHDEFITISSSVHNNLYDYSLVDWENKKDGKIIILCNIHGQFSQNPQSHIKGSRCPKCILCPSCGLWRTLGRLCVYCKPKNQNKLYQKTKEMEIVKFLKQNLPDNDFIHNKSVSSDCTGTHLFPDILFDLIFYNLIIEIDEHKHRGANYQCDEKRMYDIITKLGLPCIFIRYNPDNKLSNKNILLATVNKYLILGPEDTIIWNQFGFKAEYLFY